MAVQSGREYRRLHGLAVWGFVVPALIGSASLAAILYYLSTYWMDAVIGALP